MFGKQTTRTVMNQTRGSAEGDSAAEVVILEGEEFL